MRDDISKNAKLRDDKFHHTDQNNLAQQMLHADSPLPITPGTGEVDKPPIEMEKHTPHASQIFVVRTAHGMDLVQYRIARRGGSGVGARPVVVLGGCRVGGDEQHPTISNFATSNTSADAAAHRNAARRHIDHPPQTR